MLELPDELKEDLAKMGDDIEAVLDDAASSSHIADTFTSQTSKNVIFFGKSLDLWEDEMVVFVPPADEITPDLIRELHVELANKTQVASHYYELARAACTVSSSAFQVKKADLVTALVTHHVSTGQSVPPATVMERIVDGYMKKLASIAAINKVARDFWRGKLETLEKVTNHLSKISMSVVTEMKYLGAET